MEHDPQELVNVAEQCVKETLEQWKNKHGKSVDDLISIGITNQRETTVVWDKETGLPIGNAIAWPDTRNTDTVRSLARKAEREGFAGKKAEKGKGVDALKERTGLPLTTYFAGVKLRWLLDHDSKVRKTYDQGRLLFGTVDTWLIWNMTGGTKGGRLITDVTNASRTMFMDLKTLQWDKDLMKFFGVEKLELAEIKTCSERMGKFTVGSLKGCELTGIVGDQQAAMVGQKCFNKGEAKNTYGTGCFMLYNTGEELVYSNNGLLSTVAYKFGEHDTIYALEGSIAVAGSAVKWIRDNLGLIQSSDEIGPLAAQVEDTGGVYFVTAFSGLFAPYWRDDARGLLIGMTGYTTKAHIARATLEAICFQTKAILDAMDADAGTMLQVVRVDGGVTNSDETMQIQADILGIEVDRPAMRESTALGAAIAALFGAGVHTTWDELDVINKEGHDIFKPKTDEKRRNQRFEQWNRAVQRSYNWIEEDSETSEPQANSTEEKDTTQRVG